MKKFLTLSLSLIIYHFSFSQKKSDTLYLMIDKPQFGAQDYNSINTGFAIKSDDKRFVTDYFNFGVFNFYWSDSKQDVDYYKLSEMRREVNIDTINHKTVYDLTKDKKWWEIHNELSLKRKVFLVEKKIFPDYYNREKDSIKYSILPIMYLGTNKNTVPTDLSSKKN